MNLRFICGQYKDVPQRYDVYEISGCRRGECGHQVTGLEAFVRAPEPKNRNG